MWGILLALTSTAFDEAGNSIGKQQVHQHTASIYTFGFLTLLFGTVFLVLEGALLHRLVFSLASLPTFLPRLALELLQAYVYVRAVTISDRGDFGFFRSLTIPILLGFDVALGYAVTPLQMLGMLLIMAPVAILMYAERKDVKGAHYLLIGAVNAAFTIALYKYDITHFNSVEAEQSIVGVFLLGYYFIMARIKYNENPFRLLRTFAFGSQAFASGFATIASSFAFAFAPASIILAALRSSAILFSIGSGTLYFREKHVLLRLFIFTVVLLGLLLLIA